MTDAHNKKLLVALIAASLIAPSAAFSQEQPTPGVEEALTGAATPEPLPDYFYIPVWGLRVGGTDATRPVRSDSWKYYAVGRAILKVTPSFIDYGAHEIGTPLPQDVIKLQNVGAESLTLDKVSAPRQYIASTDCDGATLPPMATCLFTLQFSPVDVTTATGQVDIPFKATKGNSAIASIAVTATAVKPASGGPGHDLGLTANAEGSYELVFPPPIYLGDSPKFREFTLNSSGSKPLVIKEIAVTRGEMFYAPKHDCPSVLAVGASCKVTVQLNPLAVGDVTGELKVTSGSYDSSDVRVKLIAHVDEWVRKLANPSVLDFGVVDQGYATTRTVELVAAGNLPVSDVKVTVPAPFTVSGSTCTKTLQPGDKCSVTFSLNRGVLGATSATAVVTATDLSIPATNIELKANVQLRQGTFTPTSFAFGLKDMAKLAAPQKLTFTNNGSMAVTPDFGTLSTPAAASGAAGTAFKRWFADWVYLDAGSCAYPVEPGKSCEALVSVQPMQAAAQSGSTTVYPNAGMSVRGTPVSVSVTGTKQSFVYNPTALDFGVVDGMRTLEATIEVTNTSLEETALTGFGTVVTQPTKGRGSITLTGTTCGTTLTAAQKTCLIKVQLAGASLAVDEIQESNDGAINFRYSGADTNYSVVPVKFLLRGSAPKVDLGAEGAALDFGDIPVGVPAASAPRKFIQVENPGPSVMAIAGITYPGAKAYGLNVTVDHTWPNSCGFNTAIAPGTKCVIALYPNSAANATWGPVTTTAQLQTVVNGATQPLGGVIALKANHLPVTVDVQREVVVEGAEHKAETLQIPFTFNHGGSAQAGAINGTVTSLSAWLGVCSDGGVYPSGQTCKINVAVSAVKGIADRTLRIPITVRYEGGYREVDAVTFTYKPESTTYSVTPARWDMGEVPTQGLLTENAALRKYFIVKNESKRSNLVANGLASSFGLFYQFNNSGYPLTLDGVSLNPCYNRTVYPGDSCFFALDAVPSTGNLLAQGAYSGTAELVTSNALGNIPVPITATFLTGELEVLEAPDPFVDVPTATRSANKVLKLHNKGRGNLRFVSSTGMSGQFNTISSGTTVDFVLLEGNGQSYVTATNSTTSTGSTHKAAGTDEGGNCTAYMGLQPGATCSLYVAMTPAGVSRAYSGKLLLEVAAPERKRLEVPLTGNSLAASVYYSASSFDFPKDMLVGTEYKSQVVVGNGGNYSLNLSNLHIHPSGYSSSPVGSYPTTELNLTHNCPVALPPGEECVVELTLIPDRNIDWATGSPVQQVTLTESSLGVNNYKTFGLTGVSTESFLTVEEYAHAVDGVIEKANFPSQYMYTLKYTASGKAPVRILTAATTNVPVLYKNSTCTVGRILEPGDTCTVEAWTREDLASTVGAGAGQTWVLYPFTINGTQTDGAGKPIQDRGVQARLTADVVPAVSDFSLVPSVVPANRSLPMHVLHPSLRAGVQLDNDSRVATYPDVTYTDLGWAGVPKGTQGGLGSTYVANGSARDVSVKLRVKGFGPWNTRLQAAQNFDMFFEGEGAQVFTKVPSPAASRQVSYPVAGLSGGGALVVSTHSGLQFSAIDRSAKVVNTVAAGQGLSGDLVDARSVQIADDTYLVTLATQRGWCSGSGYYCSWVIQPISASYKVIVTEGAIQSVSRVAIAEDANSYDGIYSQAAFVADVNNQGTVSAIRWGNSVNYNIIMGTIAGKATGVWVYSVTQEIAGAAAVGGKFYLWGGDSIYVFDPNNWSAPSVRYSYPGVLTGGAYKGMSYSAQSSSFILPCYSGTAICTIPVLEGALGVAVVEAGIPGQRGYNDGNNKATLDVKTLLGVSVGDPVVSFVSASGASSIRAAALTGLPTFGQVGVQGEVFEAQVKEDGSMVPHVITLRNLSLNPLNILKLSDSSVGYTTTCVDIAYGDECTVTVEIPPSKLTGGAGKFSIETSLFTNPAVTWTAYATDPHWSKVFYLLDMDGTNGQKTLVDRARGVSATFTGSAQLGTSVKRHGTAALALPTSSSSIRLPAFSPRGNFTVEGWFYPVGTVGTVIDLGGVVDLNWQPLSLAYGWPNGSNLNFMASSANNGTDISAVNGCVKGTNNTTCATQMGVPQLNAWNHFAVVRSGPQYFLYLNGVRTAVLDKNVAPLSSTHPVSLGAYMASASLTPSNGFAGYLDDIRMTDGVARYTTPSFTLPQVPFPAK